jgi:hypothetical protein
MPYHSLRRLLGFWTEGEEWEVVALEVRADGWKICNFFVTTPVSYLVLQNSKLYFSKPISLPLQLCIRFTWEISTVGGSLHTWLDGARCCWHSVGRRSLGGNCSCGSLTPLVGVVDFLALLSASCVGFRFRLLSLQKSSMDGGAVTMVLAVSPLAALSLRTAVKSCSTSMYTPYRALYSCLPFRSWWRFRPVSTMFWTI